MSSLKIVKVEMPKNMYDIKCPYSMAPDRLVIHNTANDASAMAEISYMQSNTNSVSFHFAVDDVQAVQGIELNRNGWHAGDGGSGAGNRKGIGIEICYSKSGGSRFTKAEQNGALLTAMLLDSYGWGMDKVTKHQDYSGKYCPHRTLDLGWQRFLNMVKKYLDELAGSTAPPPTGAIYKVRESADNAETQLGAYADLNNAKKVADANRGYKVYDTSGKLIYDPSSSSSGGTVSQEEYDELLTEFEKENARRKEAEAERDKAVADLNAVRAVVNK